MKKMHKIDQFIADLRQAREADTAAFMAIHLRIMDTLGWRTVPNIFERYDLRSFALVKWPHDNTLRISYPAIEKNYPFGMSQVPTQDVQDAFFRELENEVAE